MEGLGPEETGLRASVDMPRGLGVGYRGRAESWVRSGARAGSEEGRGYPENSTCPSAVGLKSKE